MTNTSRTAVLSTDTTCITGNGRAGTVPAGEYPIVDIDGAAESGSMFIEVGAELVAISLHSAGLNIVEGSPAS